MQCGCMSVQPIAYQMYVSREPHCLNCGADAMKCSVVVPALPVDRYGDPMLYEPIKQGGNEYEVVSDTGGDIVAYRALGDGEIEVLDLAFSIPRIERFTAADTAFHSRIVSDYHICLVLGHYYYSRDIAGVEGQEQLIHEHNSVVEESAA